MQSSSFPIEVFYDNQCVGIFKADIVVDDLIMLELKSAINILKEFEVQIVNYLTATKKDVRLILNFGPQKVEATRKVRILTKES